MKKIALHHFCAMRRLLTATATVVACMTAAANAATLTVGYEFTSFPPPGIFTAAQSVDPANGTLTGGFVASDFTVSYNMTTGSTINLAGYVLPTIDPALGNSLNVYLSWSNITAPTGSVSFHNEMNFPSVPSWWTVSGAIYVDDASAPDGGNNIFSHAAFMQPNFLVANPGLFAFDSVFNVDPSGPYSVIQVYSFEAHPVPVAQTPLPAAVWLFGAGLGGMIILGRRRKLNGGETSIGLRLP